MCTYSITLNDSLVEKVRPAFADDEALQQWLQKKLSDYTRHLITLSLPTATKRHRHESLCGILDTAAPEEDLVEEYLKEKYSL